VDMREFELAVDSVPRVRLNGCSRGPPTAGPSMGDGKWDLPAGRQEWAIVMSGYLVLARKYRSTTFDEVVGQEAISRTLVNAIKGNRIHHAYLFAGTRGVGKTTMARILAKALNCLSSDGPTITPCGECDACRAIARGDDVDVVEIDGASNRGIDEIRELRANSIFRPARSRYKIYYIDEVHMLTKEAFNALLKTLEEPPEHVKFIFATTETEKVPATILSRCQRYDFRNIPTRQIAAHLASICKAEKVQADEDALFRIARAAAGSMRDGLSLLDQLLAAGNRVSDADVVRVLGTPSDERMLAIAAAVSAGSAAGALTELSAVLEAGVSLGGVAAALGEVFRNMMVAAVCGAASELIELPEAQRKAVADLAGHFTVPVLVQAVGICQNVARAVRGSSVGRALVEAALVRLAEADKFVDAGSLIDRLEALAGGQAAAGGEKKKPIAYAPARPAAGPASAAAGPTGSRPADAGSGGAGPGRARPAGPAAPPSGSYRGASPAVPAVPAAGRPSPSAPSSPGQTSPAPANYVADGTACENADQPGPAGRQVGAAPPPPAPVRPPLALSTAERNELARDPAVKAVLGLFGGDVVDIRVDNSQFATGGAEDETPEE
jgi:DNA polymerase III subunit gamma/tau